MLLMVDNRDSFTYNLVHYFKVLGCDTHVVRSHSISVSECLQLKPTHVVFSPGPGNPKTAGITLELMQALLGKVPMLGVCLGMQAMAELFQGHVVQATHPMHGKISKIFHSGEDLFQDLPSFFNVVRYHSLTVDFKTLPSCLEVTAWTEDNVIMGLKHKEFNLQGVQFHPESVLTEHGYALLNNFLRKQYDV